MQSTRIREILENMILKGELNNAAAMAYSDTPCAYNLILKGMEMRPTDLASGEIEDDVWAYLSPTGRLVESAGYQLARDLYKSIKDGIDDAIAKYWILTTAYKYNKIINDEDYELLKTSLCDSEKNERMLVNKIEDLAYNSLIAILTALGARSECSAAKLRKFRCERSKYLEEISVLCEYVMIKELDMKDVIIQHYDDINKELFMTCFTLSSTIFSTNFSSLNSPLIHNI